MVAHFDYYYNRGNPASVRGVVLIPRTTCGTSKMKDTDDTTGGYVSSIAHTTTCPAITSALSTVLGGNLLSNILLLSNATNASIPSMMGSNFTGASSNWVWTATQCVLPNEIQIYGSTVCSSSMYDVGECEKLAIFNFISQVEYYRATFWLRAVASSTTFARASGEGNSGHSNASINSYLRPLIYIG